MMPSIKHRGQTDRITTSATDFSTLLTLTVTVTLTVIYYSDYFRHAMAMTYP